MRRVIIESPYAGYTDRNLRYLRACMRDCLLRGEAPFASHALYTQPGVLDDNNPHERRLGVEAGFEWHSACDAVVVYENLGISPGMAEGIQRAKDGGWRIEYRTLWSWGK